MGASSFLVASHPVGTGLGGGEREVALLKLLQKGGGGGGGGCIWKGVSSSCSSSMHLEGGGIQLGELINF